MVLIKNANIVNEHSIYKGSVLVNGNKIERIYKGVADLPEGDAKIIDATGLFLMPGVIDMHVHFREPGLTYKADTESESRAALAGGVTSYAEMPNTVPKTIGIDELNHKFNVSSENSYINFSYYMGVFKNNFDFINSIDNDKVPGVKVFMGASTGNMQVGDSVLEKLYSQKKHRITAHCEDDSIIEKNTEFYKSKFGDSIPFEYHPKIRSNEACLSSSVKAINLAKEYGSRLHIAHVSTAEEADLFEANENPKLKQVTAEVCAHHLWFNSDDYKAKGSLIKWNPAIKDEADRLALIKALKDNRIDIIVTDHAPHSFEEKQGDYTKVPSGAPMIQHSLQVAFELHKQGHFSLEMVVDKMCHKPAELFGIKNRGYIREGYYGDLVLLNPNKKYTVSKENILYKCGWSPLEGTTFSSTVEYVLVNGALLYDKGKIGNKGQGMPLVFNS